MVLAARRKCPVRASFAVNLKRAQASPGGGLLLNSQRGGGSFGEGGRTALSFLCRAGTCSAGRLTGSGRAAIAATSFRKARMKRFLLQRIFAETPTRWEAGEAPEAEIAVSECV